MASAQGNLGERGIFCFEMDDESEGVTVSDCISLCFQNLNCKSINYDRTQSTCHIYSTGQANANVKKNPSYDFYEFNCESQFGGMALCTNEGIRFIVNTKEPYTVGREVNGRKTD